MKQFDNFFDDVISLPNLYYAFAKAAKDKSRNKGYMDFCENLHENLLQLHLELLNGTYLPGKYEIFYLEDYKRRKIAAPKFRDQVVQHAIFNFLEQIYEPFFIYDSFACRKDKGTHKAFYRVKQFIRKHEDNDYFMKCDISKYFYSIDHYRLKSIIRIKIKDDRILNLADKFIDSYSEEKIAAQIENPEVEIQKKGIPIGSLLSQLFANVYLNELDFYIKHELRIKHYARYVDDFVIVGGGKEMLMANLREIKIYLSERLLLKLEDRKVQLNVISFGIDFVGYVGFKKYSRVRTRNYRRFKQRFKIKINEFMTKKVSLYSLKCIFASYRGHVGHTNSKGLNERAERIYNRLMAKIAVKRGGNWDNGANDGPFSGNVNNDPSNTNNNIGFRCCSEPENTAVLSRKHGYFKAQMPLPSSRQCCDENLSRNTTGFTPVISAMNIRGET